MVVSLQPIEWASLSDLYGQFRFLRIFPFDRPSFWKNNIEDPCCEHSYESLCVLRKLLSHFVIRHSKDPTSRNGQALLALPSRTVETVFLDISSSEEKTFHDCLDARNRTVMQGLRRELRSKIVSNFLPLNGLLHFARQACCHPSLVDLRKVQSSQLRFEAQVRSSPAKGSGTRAGVLAMAIQRARHSCKDRMRQVVTEYQESDSFLECPVCLDVVGESDIAIPACAHPSCRECLLSLLSGESSTRVATGRCVICRDVMKRSEFTFLGDAADRGARVDEASTKESEHQDEHPVVTTKQGFQMAANNVHASATGASTTRAGFEAVTNTELWVELRDAPGYFSRLGKDFIPSHSKARRQVGTKISKLLEEIQRVTCRDAQSKCCVFSQFLGMLDIASAELSARGIPFVRLDGNCKQHERADALLEFSSNPSVKVFLLSFRAGAVGLNLLSADHVCYFGCSAELCDRRYVLFLEKLYIQKFFLSVLTKFTSIFSRASH